MLEAKKEALRNEASRSVIIGTSLQEKFAELDSIKPQPYGTRHAVGTVYIYGILVTYTILGTPKSSCSCHLLHVDFRVVLLYILYADFCFFGGRKWGR